MTKTEATVVDLNELRVSSSAQVIAVVPHEHYERSVRREQSSWPELWEALDEVKDPEIPVLSLWDLGVLRNVERDELGVLVTITPTYSGCPAMDVMQEDILAALEKLGESNSRIEVTLSPAWTTAWLSDEGKKSLQEWGIAPPCKGGANQSTPTEGVECPLCHSTNTVSVSEFGSTACKALFKCNSCLEPFDYFKHI